MANKERILKLIDHLESGKGPSFDMDTFFNPVGHFDLDTSEVDDLKEAVGQGDNWCGTQACIAGHAAILALKSGDPEDSRRGHQIIISTALFNAGAICDDDTDKPKYDLEGKIVFKDSK